MFIPFHGGHLLVKIEFREDVILQEIVPEIIYDRYGSFHPLNKVWYTHLYRLLEFLSIGWSSMTPNHNNRFVSFLPDEYR